jgi:hypothetical protein
MLPEFSEPNSVAFKYVGVFYSHFRRFGGHNTLGLKLLTCKSETDIFLHVSQVLINKQKHRRSMPLRLNGDCLPKVREHAGGCPACKKFIPTASTRWGFVLSVSTLPDAILALECIYT